MVVRVEVEDGIKKAQGNLLEALRARAPRSPHVIDKFKTLRGGFARPAGGAVALRRGGLAPSSEPGPPDLWLRLKKGLATGQLPGLKLRRMKGSGPCTRCLTKLIA